MSELTIENKEQILSKLAIRLDDVILFTGYSKRKCQDLMQYCRDKLGGRAGYLTDAITPKSLCEALGTTLEDELKIIYIAKGKK